MVRHFVEFPGLQDCFLIMLIHFFFPHPPILQSSLCLFLLPHAQNIRQVHFGREESEKHIKCIMCLNYYLKVKCPLAPGSVNEALCRRSNNDYKSTYLSETSVSSFSVCCKTFQLCAETKSSFPKSLHGTSNIRKLDEWVECLLLRHFSRALRY